MNIWINSSDVVKYGKKIADYTNDFNDEIKKLNALIESINEIWNGADALKYINVMKEKYVAELNEIKKILDDYSEYLIMVPETYETLDEVFSTKSIDS